jgi:hypothetical protein
MRRYQYFTALLLAVIIFTAGCDYGSKEIQGPDRMNVPPEVQFVNIPVEDAKFSSDTTIYWYGTDVDGFIIQFRYAVVRGDVVGSDWEAYVTATGENMPWNYLDVELNDPQTNERVKMSADISDPVRKYVESYVFLQAKDNMGAYSEVVARKFLKNNHFPNTFINGRGVGDPYVNAVSGGGILQGVSVSWSGEDVIDYPRNPPPFEFQWRFYGPYDSAMMHFIDTAVVESVFVDIYGDFYFDCDSYPTFVSVDSIVDTIWYTIDSFDVDIELIFDTTFTEVCELGRGNPYGEWQEILQMDVLDTIQYTDANGTHSLNRLIDSSYNNLTDDPWVSDLGTHIYDVYRNETSVDTTVQYNFLTWCQARDDSQVPDPVPAFHWLSVIEPRFERDVIIVDATPYGKSSFGFWNWPVFPQKIETGATDYPFTTVPLIKQIYGDLINNWQMPSGSNAVFDVDNLLPNVKPPECGGRITLYYELFHATQDYFPIAKLSACEDMGIPAVTLRDILKHKIILIFKDMPSGQLIMDSQVMLSVLDGLSAGLSAWSMTRSPFNDFDYQTNPTGTYQDVPDSYRLFFGINEMWHTSWMGTINYSLTFSGTRIEDFVGADIINNYADDFSNLVVDTTLLEDRYLWVPGPPGISIYDYRCNVTGDILVGALPEVDFVEKSPLAEALYLYHSKYGTQQLGMEENCDRLVGRYADYHGTVVGTRYNAGLFRTAHFSFSLLPFPEEDARPTFNSMMTWLAEQPYIQTGKVASNMTAKPAVNGDIQEMRRVLDKLHDLKDKGLLRSYKGMESR